MPGRAHQSKNAVVDAGPPRGLPATLAHRVERHDAEVPAVDSRHFCASARVIIAGPTAWSER
jgi:hypothetical protein